MGAVGDFIAGYVGGILTVAAISFAVGYYVFTHPKAMVRMMTGRKRRGNRVDKRETTTDSAGG